MLKKKPFQIVCFLLIFIISLGIGIRQVNNYDINNEIINDNNQNEYKTIIETSGFWTPGIISIDDTDWGNTDWDTIDDNPWCSGAGTWADPYIIENVSIDAQDSGSCILIQNSRKYFRIENCTLIGSESGSLYNPQGGIKTYNTTNGLMINNNCSNNNGAGIVISEESHNHTIMQNLLFKNKYGVRAYNNTSNNSIIENTILNMTSDGIEFTNANLVGGISDYNTIAGNIIKYCENPGIAFSISNDIWKWNNISNNIIYKNEWGINFEGWSDQEQHHNYTVSDNNITESTYQGIFLGYIRYSNISNNYFEKNDIVDPGFAAALFLYERCEFNTIRYNKFIDNYKRGIWVYGLVPNGDNLFYGNEFRNSGIINAQDDGGTNYWNNSIIGNFYDDLTGDYTDLDDDGIIDNNVIYNITGTANAQDKLPLYDDGFSGNNLIINDISSNNWAWALTKPWCSGSGTEGDPYVISPSIIDAWKSGSSITINNSRTYFRIENCSLYNSSSGPNWKWDAGVRLENTTNGYIINNNMYNNSGYGVHIYDGCENNTIINNTMIYNTLGGVDIRNGSNYNQFIGNHVNLTRFTNPAFSVGTILDPVPCNSNIVSENQIFNNGGTGLLAYMTEDAYGNILNDNIIYGNNDGLIVTKNAAHLCYNYTISGNYIYNNVNNGMKVKGLQGSIISNNNLTNNGDTTSERGIYVEGDNNYNNFTSNYIFNSSGHGIYVSSSGNTNNRFYNNTLIDNLINAEDDASNNDWNYTNIGNYWSNYSGIDINDDGLGDTIHPIQGDAGAIDFTPMWWDPPNITLITPNEDDLFGVESPNFEVLISEGYNDTTWLSLYNGTWSDITFFTGTSGQINQNIWNNIGNGTVTIQFFANDSMGAEGFDNITVRKDAVIPDITIDLPTPNFLIGINAPNFNLTIVEEDLDSTWYSLNGGENKTFTGNGTINQNLWSALSNGTVTIRFYANDSAGNIGVAVIVYKIDILAPLITIDYPQLDGIYGSTSPDYLININEANMDKMWYSFDGGDTIHFIDSISGKTVQDVWDALPNGEVTITFYANDTVGNVGSASVTFTKNPEENLLIFVLIGIIVAVSAAGVIVVRRSRSKLKDKEAELAALARERETTTEDDILVSKEKHFCLVHKGPIEGYTYICECGTYYCTRCVEALKKNENECWSCGKALDPSKPTKGISEKKEEIKAINDKDAVDHKKSIKEKADIKSPEPEKAQVIEPEPVSEPALAIPLSSESMISPETEAMIKKFDDYIQQAEAMIQKLDIKFSAGAISQEEFLKKKTFLAEKIGEAMAKRDQLKEQQT